MNGEVDVPEFRPEQVLLLCLCSMAQVGVSWMKVWLVELVVCVTLLVRSGLQVRCACNGGECACFGILGRWLLVIEERLSEGMGGVVPCVGVLGVSALGFDERYLMFL